jgi:hypothetical protein
MTKTASQGLQTQFHSFWRQESEFISHIRNTSLRRDKGDFRAAPLIVKGF